MKKTLLKVGTWLSFMLSTMYLSVHIGLLPTIAIIVATGSFYLLMWMDDIDNGRLNTRKESL